MFFLIAATDAGYTWHLIDMTGQPVAWAGRYFPTERQAELAARRLRRRASKLSFQHGEDDRWRAIDRNQVRAVAATASTDPRTATAEAHAVQRELFNALGP